ncbi:MAG: FAD-binding oxidoreductase [Porticoccaceae bacterium]|jgi:alkyldihydroxyacetonephosphate synthase|nr:FAD-binding oxidoreductase [Porticoccaceae bacterium]MBT4591300.1 FAD-binding oxidoreductase [Porticoccaceae bacterium]
MRLWNGWGNENSDLTMELNNGLSMLLQALVGPGTPLPQATLNEVIAKVPPTRLDDHPLINSAAEIRVRHARGQSLPDWLDMHSGDVSTFPDGVAMPESSEQVRELLDHAKANDIVVIPYGGGTSVVGHINPEESDRPVLTIDMGNMNQLLNIDTESQLATFGAGIAGPAVEEALKKQGFTLGHFPQSWELSTLGGWVASRSSGQQSIHYGRIENLFAGGSIETLAGTLDIPTIPASSAGPDVREMILGSEGRMGIITEVTVRITPLPEKELFQVVFFPSWEIGITVARELIQQRVALSMVRLSNPLETTSLLYMGAGEDSSGVVALEQALAEKGIGSGKVMMTLGVTGSARHCEAAHQLALDHCSNHGGVADQLGLGDNWAHGRFRAPYLRDPLGAAGYAADTMETAVDWSKVPQAAENIEQAIRTALADEGEQVHAYTHLSHVYGQGSSIYTTYLFRLGDSYQQGMDRWVKLKKAGADQIVGHGGTISHQHGVGRDHRNYLSAEKGQLGIAAINNLCELFDPNGQMNPGKLLPDSEH